MRTCCCLTSSYSNPQQQLEKPLRQRQFLGQSFPNLASHTPLTWNGFEPRGFELTRFASVQGAGFCHGSCTFLCGPDHPKGVELNCGAQSGGQFIVRCKLCPRNQKQGKTWCILSCCDTVWEAVSKDVFVCVASRGWVISTVQVREPHFD